MTKQASLLDPADDLTQVLGPDLAAHFIAHRKALKKPMTSFAGQLMAKKLRTFPDPVAAVEQAILKGWSDVYPVEAPAAPRTNGRPASPIEARTERLKEKIVNDYGIGRQGSSDPKDAQLVGLPSLTTH